MLNTEVKKLTPAEVDKFTELIRVFEDVFEMKPYPRPGEDYLRQLLEKDSFMVFVSLYEGQVIGGLTTYTLEQYYSTSPLVYIYDLAVKTEHQRKGVGRMLISALTTFCKGNGVEEVFVQADLADGYALDFYRSTGGIPEEVVHFNYPLQDKD